ncbi:hypothetical protein BDY17DRAFT_327680 [Neohortaea acidophila]|uniref:AMP-dependent synthetase/ligase domain-containing protein n=1 Tax=Neohortaea acidophila TaxID=245834 RepID=A0A6A6PJP4_9PEZI|nr:uncharacterized protein BDY17DRAFT_327680 [Neohortaea acidophila]KAF2479743.1 hypothetical protein BDY17DRAFT_327680 [Neohortaea acidophila]
MALATGAAVAAAAAYLDAKYHLRKDLTKLHERRHMTKLVQKSAQQNRMSLWYPFEQQVHELQDEQCLWYRSQPSDPAVTYSWTETYDQCCRYAQFLLQNGVQPGDLISTYLINSPESMFTLVGSWGIGSAPAMINYNLSGDALIHSLNVAQAKLLLVDDDEACRKRIEDVQSRIENDLGMKIVVLDAATKAAISALAPTRPANEYRESITGAFPLFLFYTSGSTGLPKACAMPTAAGLTLGEPRRRSMGLKSGKGGDVWYDCMPLYHGTGCTVAVGCLITGIKLAIGRRFSVRSFWHDIHDSQAAAFVYVGETARYLLAAPPSLLDKTHKVRVVYGNGMRPDIWRKFMDRFDIACVNEFFNSTEGMLSLLNVCVSPFYDSAVGHHGAILRYANRNYIVPVRIDYEKGDEIWRDPQTGFAKRAPYEEGGEILIACASQGDFVGYYNNPDATNKRFVRDVFRKGDLYYRTGDALRRDADGRWFFMDRLGDTFRWKSENVSTAEVAEVLGRFPNVVETNVYGVEIPNHDGRAGCAAIYIPHEQRRSFDWRALLQHAQKGLPKYAVPVFVRLVQRPSPMHNNKQNKVPFRKEGVDLKSVAEGEAGRDDAMMWLPPGGDRYVPFQQKDWEAVSAGKARL